MFLWKTVDLVTKTEENQMEAIYPTVINGFETTEI
jgi:hypothetical protein